MVTEATLPEDIIFEILIRVPALPLIRFRSVSKSWCKLITSQLFRKTHLKYLSSKERDNTKLIAFMTPEYYERIRQADLPFDIRRVDVPYDIHLPSRDHELELPHCVIKRAEATESVVNTYLGRILGSCNGLLLLSHRGDELFTHLAPTTKGQFLTLFNPTTREYKELPPWLPITSPSDASFRRISLSTNSWEKLQDLPYYVTTHTPALFLNGAIHWAARDKYLDNEHKYEYRRFPLAYDVAKKRFREIPPPDYDQTVSYIKIAVFDGQLCLLCYFRKFIKALSMRNYGLKDSWTVIFTVACDGGIFNRVSVPLCHTKEGDFLLSKEHGETGGLGEPVDKELVVYNPCDKTFTGLKVDDEVIFVRTPSAFVESLVALNGNDDTVKETPTKGDE